MLMVVATATILQLQLFRKQLRRPLTNTEKALDLLQFFQLYMAKLNMTLDQTTDGLVFCVITLN